MRADWTHLEPNRDTPRDHPEYRSSTGDRFGWFVWKFGSTMLRAMAADAESTGWEHVSVTIVEKRGGKWVSRLPTWGEMCSVKQSFWDPSECVVQFHPPESDYVNQHVHCLHLWKQVPGPFPMPPTILV